MKCPFCEKEVSEFHPNSDVAPDWLYKHSFKNNKNRKSFEVDFKEEAIEFAQSALKGSFICWDCEKNFGKTEGYARLVFGEKTNHESVPNVTDAKRILVRTQNFGELEGFKLLGLDFKKIQKFVFGVVLKGHMAKTGLTSDLLGEKHFHKMRRIFQDEQQEDDITYPVFVFKFDEKRPLWNQVTQPCRSKTKEGLSIITFKGGGYEFNINVQSHALPKGGETYRFRKDGSLLILRAVENPVAMNRFLSDAKKLKNERWGK